MENGAEYVERLNFPISDLGGEFKAVQFEMNEGTGMLNEKPNPDYVKASLTEVSDKEEIPEGSQYWVELDTKGYIVKNVYLLTDGYEEEAFYVDDKWYISTTDPKVTSRLEELGKLLLSAKTEKQFQKLQSQ